MQYEVLNMLHWLSNKLVADESAQWITECAQWIIAHFDQESFWQRTQLVTPDASYFPAKLNNQEEMAAYVLTRVTQLAGVADWPWVLQPAQRCSTGLPPLLEIDPRYRHKNGVVPPQVTGATLEVPFVVEQMQKPQDFVASTAHACAQHILWQSRLPVPGGPEFFQQTAEVLAVFLGFGIVMANSAYTFRGSCAKCYNPRANRQANLSESEAVFALALFCTIKSEHKKNVLKHLKPYLRGAYKVALRQANNQLNIAKVNPSAQSIVES